MLTFSPLNVLVRSTVIREIKKKKKCSCDNKLHLSYNWIPNYRGGAMISKFIKVPEQKLSALNIHANFFGNKICKWSFSSHSKYIGCSNDFFFPVPCCSASFKV